jgi:ATP-dependent helicase/nuclease subunit B
LERNIFREEKEEPCPDSSGISIFSIKDTDLEVEFIAGEIKRLVREENYRYHDIGVVTGNLEGVYKKLETVSEKIKLPAFIDYKKKYHIHSHD